MEQKIYTVYDQKAESFLPPFFVPTRGLAVRAFEDCVNSKDHQFGKHPQDYTLFYLGTFDQDNASWNIESPQSQGNGVEFVRLELSDSEAPFHEIDTNPAIRPNGESHDPT